MRILIIGPPRSGTTSLIRELCNITKYQFISEPYNYKLRSIENYYQYPLTLEENSVCKTLTLQSPLDFNEDYLKFIQEFNKNFDRTILLTRLNKEDHILSTVNLKIRIANGAGNHSPWYKEEVEKYKHIVNYDTDILPHINAVNQTADLLNLTPIPYEVLYGNDRKKSLEIIKNLDLNLDSKDLNERLDPKFRYRKLSSKPVI